MTLDEGQSHYLANVMRQKQGAFIELFNGRDGSWQAELVTLSRKSVTVLCIQQTTAQHASPDVWLLFAPVKRARLDFMAQKATELGVTSIQPIICDFTTVSHKSLRLKTQHWQNICHSACEQSGLNMPPTVHKICSFEQWIGAQKSLHIIANPVSTSTFNSLTTTPESLAITIGPEGGFSAQELTLIANSNVTEISMGHRILRADTASIAIVSLCQQKWGDL